MKEAGVGRRRRERVRRKKKHKNCKSSSLTGLERLEGPQTATAHTATAARSTRTAASGPWQCGRAAAGCCRCCRAASPQSPAQAEPPLLDHSLDTAILSVCRTRLAKWAYSTDLHPNTSSSLIRQHSQSKRSNLPVSDINLLSSMVSRDFE